VYTSQNTESNNQLPNLLKTSNLPGSKSQAKNDKDMRINLNTLQNSGFDILFIKRLMYLKNSIDDDKYIAKEKRDLSGEKFEKEGGNAYPNAMSSALLSMKPGEINDATLNENILSAKGKFYI